MTSRFGRKFYVRLALTPLLMCVVFLCQNCAAPFDAKNQARLSSSGAGTDDGGGDDVVTPPVGSLDPSTFLTADKVIGTITTAKFIDWNLQSEVQYGNLIPNSTMRVTIEKFTPPDGTGDTYYISLPTITAGVATQLRSMRVRINGLESDISTTFMGLDTMLAASETKVLSNATLIVQIAGASQPTDTIGLAFAKLGKPGEAPLPPPALKPGITLYATYCANCHGALSVSTKSGRTAAMITSAFALPEMSNLPSLLTPAQVKLIADVLAK